VHAGGVEVRTRATIWAAPSQSREAV